MVVGFPLVAFEISPVFPQKLPAFPPPATMVLPPLLVCFMAPGMLMQSYPVGVGAEDIWFWYEQQNGS